MNAARKLNLSNGSGSGMKHMLDSTVPFGHRKTNMGMIVELKAPGVLTHDEHDRMVLEPGDYHVYNQVEWNPFEQSLSYIFD